MTTMQAALLQMANAHTVMAEALRALAQHQAAGGAQEIAMMFGMGAQPAAGDVGEGIKGKAAAKVKKEKKPRKPRNVTGYNLFMREQMQKLKVDGDGKGGSKSFGEEGDKENRLKIIGAQWKELGEGQQKYLHQAKLLAEAKDKPEGDHLADDEAASDDDVESDHGKEATKDDDTSSDSSDEEERRKERERKEKKREKKEKKKRKEKDGDDGEKKHKKHKKKHSSD
uniref:HMG box domain-containing protein n=2 Tax=Hemiselmis andersenii TaxID=464988 RepID=A0A7S0XYN2_HEMAN|mmetsp:Transcript_3542/g.8500  ORF Transcript_3542/g.8500 Transcript_3542/m.8500 type:complete len:226 (+) Transcript_3542:154-831(+)